MYHLTVGKERNLGHGMKDMRKVRIIGAAIGHVALKHCFSKSTLHIHFTPPFKIELVVHIVNVVFFFITLNSSTTWQRQVPTDKEEIEK